MCEHSLLNNGIFSLFYHIFYQPRNEHLSFLFRNRKGNLFLTGSFTCSLVKPVFSIAQIVLTIFVTILKVGTHVSSRDSIVMYFYLKRLYLWTCLDLKKILGAKKKFPNYRLCFCRQLKKTGKPPKTNHSVWAFRIPMREPFKYEGNFWNINYNWTLRNHTGSFSIWPEGLKFVQYTWVKMGFFKFDQSNINK